MKENDIQRRAMLVAGAGVFISAMGAPRIAGALSDTDFGEQASFASSVSTGQH